MTWIIIDHDLVKYCLCPFSLSFAVELQLILNQTLSFNPLSVLPELPEFLSLSLWVPSNFFFSVLLGAISVSNFI